ncbi:transcription antitermination protein nusG [Brevinema andersonii]|uniref:Transcription termination/antitermination protein NusG n=1 Tax=Brevinema andersonii TaxID=34097 RepID=A0A1I1D0N1_BREAD|nr:transcription antitermination protein nusG [Brevinema andersonii]
MIQVQTGFENKVYSRLLEKKNGGSLRDVLIDVRVPEEEIVVEKRNKKVVQKHKLYPGYVLVELDLPEDEMAWKAVYADIRNIVGVGMFLTAGGGNRKPAPLTFEEVRGIFEKTGDIASGNYAETAKIWDINEKIRIVDGPFKDFEGVIDEINGEKEMLVVAVEIFGRLTPVELEFNQVQKI